MVLIVANSFIAAMSCSILYELLMSKWDIEDRLSIFVVYWFIFIICLLLSLFVMLGEVGVICL